MKQKVILLVEDYPKDEALRLRALGKHNIRNEVVAPDWNALGTKLRQLVGGDRSEPNRARPMGAGRG